MRISTALAAAAIILAMVPASATPPSLYDANAAYLNQWHPAATPAQVQEVAALLTSNGIDLGGAGPDAILIGGYHVGEVWTLCQDVSWFFGGGPTPCEVSNLSPTGLPCASVPAHWALFVWAPATLTWTITGGTPGFSPITYYWTETHLGLTPGPQLGGGTFVGSGCVFRYHFAPGDELVIGYGTGFFDPA